MRPPRSRDHIASLGKQTAPAGGRGAEGGAEGTAGGGGPKGQGGREARGVSAAGSSVGWLVGFSEKPLKTPKEVK